MSEPSTFEKENLPSEPEGLEFLDEVLEPEELLPSKDPEPTEVGWESLEEEAEHAEMVDEQPELRPGAGLGLASGIALTLFGVFLAFATTSAPKLASSLTGPLENISSSALPLVLAGMLVCGFAILFRRQNAIELAIHDAKLQAGRMQPGLEYLVQAQEHHLDRPPASGEELDRVLYLLQTQDEKLKNLTKAIKMYGRPLVEISNQSSEAGHELTQLNNTMSKVTVQMERLPSVEQLSGEFKSNRGATTEDIAELLKGHRGPSADEMRSGVEELMNDQVDKVLAKVQESSERVAKGVDKLLEQGEKSSDAALQDIKRDLTSLGNTLSAVQNSIAQGAARQPVAAAAPAARPAPAAAPAPVASSGSSGGSSGIGGLAHSIAGTKKAPSKNVLGAIAKLKQMRN